MKRALGFSIPIFIFLITSAITTVANCKERANDVQAVAQLFAAWNSRDADKVAGCFSESAVYEDVAAGQFHRGRDEIRQWAAGAFRDIGDFKIEVLRSFVKDGRASVEWNWSGVDKGLMKTGKNFSVRGVSLIEVRRGRVTNYKEYYDFATVMRQLGLLAPE